MKTGVMRCFSVFFHLRFIQVCLISNFCIMLVCVLFCSKVTAQSSCSTAVQITSTNIDSTIQYGNTGPVFWFRFTALHPNYAFSISPSVQTPYAGFHYIELFTDSCTNLRLVRIDSSDFVVRGLTLGSEYFISIHKVNTGQSYFNFSMSVDTLTGDNVRLWEISDCPPDPCDLIMNPDFVPEPDYNPYTWPDNTNPFFSNSDEGKVCGWLTLAGSPNMFGFPSDDYLHLLCYVSNSVMHGEAVYQNIPVIPVNGANYLLTIDYRLWQADILDGLCIYLVDPNLFPTTPLTYNNLLDLRQILDNMVILNQGRNLSVINLPANTNWTPLAVNYLNADEDFTKLIIFPWDMVPTSQSDIHLDSIHLIQQIQVSEEISHSCSGKLDGAIDLTVSCGIPPLTYVWSNGATTQDISGVNPGSYTVTITHGGGAPIILTYVIQQFSFPVQPDLGHYIVSNCGQNPGTYQYQINNPEPGVVYTWSVLPSNAANFVNGINVGNNVGIEWTNVPSFPTQATIVIHCSNSTTGCEMDFSYEFNSPCIPSGIPFNLQICNATSSSQGFINNTVYVGQTYLVNGEFIINNNGLDFSYCTFILGPLANIRLVSNITTTFRNCTIQGSNCGHMWDGIYNEYLSSILIIRQGVLTDAINGLVSKNGGQMDIFNNQIRNNYYNIKASDYQPPAGTNVNISLKQNTIQGTISLPYPPMSPSQTHSGLLIENLGTPNTGDGIIVGNPSIALDKNFFVNLWYGIYASRSNLKVYNNDFTNNLGSSNSASAISVLGHTQMLGQPYPRYSLTVGGSGLQVNSITGYHGGITTTGTLNTSISGNTLTNCVRSVSFSECGIAELTSFCPTTVNISYNTITGGSLVGIQGIANPNCTATMLCNNISMLNITPKTCGISLAGTSPNNGNEIYHVNSNTLTSCHGLLTLNNYRIIANNNTITLHNNSNPADITYGMRFQNCNYEGIDNNRILGTAAANKIGMSIENTTDHLFRCNTIKYCDIAFLISGTNVHNPANIVSLRQNNFQYSTYGMVKINFGNFGTQGNYTTPWLNKWTSVTAHTYSVSAISDNTYVRTFIANENYIPIGSGFNKISVSCNPCLVPLCPTAAICGSGSLALQGIEENITSGIQQPDFSYLEDVIVDSVSADEVNKYLRKQKLFALTVTDAGFYNQNTNLNNFSSVTSNESIGKLYYSDYYIGRGMPYSASIYNESFSYQNIADSLHQWVNRQIISYLSGMELNVDDKTALCEIAALCPFEYGDGVYFARAFLLRMDPETQIVSHPCEYVFAPSHKSMQQGSATDSEPIEVRVYPNPASDQLSIEITGTEGLAEIVFFNMLGYQVNEQQFSIDEINSIELSVLAPGIYLYEIRISGKTIKADRIAVIR